MAARFLIFACSLISLLCYAVSGYLRVGLLSKPLAAQLAEWGLVTGLTIAILTWPSIRGWKWRLAVAVTILLASAAAYLARASA